MTPSSLGGVGLALLDAAPVGDPGWQPFVNLGAIGVLAVVLLGFAKGAYQREVKRADAAEAALQALQTKVIDLYVPAVSEATRVVGEFLAEARRDRR